MRPCQEVGKRVHALWLALSIYFQLTAPVKIVPLLIGLFLMMEIAFADLKIPRSVFTMDRLDEAKSEALEKEKPLVFVWTNPGST